LRVSATNLANENEPEENPEDFPITHRTSNLLYRLLAIVRMLKITVLTPSNL